MAENCKIISVTANNPVVTIPNGEKVATAVTKEIITNVPAAPITTSVSDSCVQSNLSGLGEEWIPDSRLFKFNTEELSLNDYLKTHAFKVLLESTALTDTNSKHSRKVLSDIADVTDSFDRVWNIIRSHNDSTTHSELLRFSVAKALNETKHFNELLKFDARKTLNDSVHMADLTKILILVSSGKFEHVYTSDIYSRIVNYVRVFTEQVDATDDFYGLANIDDDQYAFVSKIVLEWLTPVERFSVRFTKSPILDIADVNDTIAKRTEKILSDYFAVSIDEPFFTINLDKREILSTTERYSKVFDKIADDETASIVEEVAISLFKTFEDTLTITDDFFITRYKGAEEFTAMQDLVNFLLNSTLSDSFNTADLLAFDTSKVLESDTATMNEPLFTKIVSLCVNEMDYFLEAYTLEDYTFRAVHAQDAITDVRFTKILTDIVDATDDFYGAFNVDDDQYAAVTKVLADSYSMSDTFSRLVDFKRSYTDSISNTEVVSTIVGKALLDTAVSSETVSKGFSTGREDSYHMSDLATSLTNKAVNDSTSNSEFRLFSAAKVLVDNVSKNETISKIVTTFYEDVAHVNEIFSRVFNSFRTFTETVSKTDLALLLVGKGVVDLISASELVTRFVSKANNDTTTTSEVRSFSTSKTLSELVDATDDFYGAANVDDDQYALVAKTLADSSTLTDVFSRVVTYVRSYTDTVLKSDLAVLQFTKNLSETSHTSEYITKTEAKVLSENASTSQTVQLGIQNYFATNYVVPGYVGNTFTY